MSLLHRVIHPLLPAWLGLRGLLAQPYQRRLLAYQRDFLDKHRAHPGGIDYRLVGVESVAPHSYAYRLRAPTGIEHRCGHTLLVKWRNSDQEVARVIAAGGWTGSDTVRLHTSSSAFAPGGRIDTDLYTALRDHVEIRSVAPCLRALLGGSRQVPDTLADFLASLESGRRAIGRVLAMQPRIKPRSYTICGVQPSPDGDTIEIMVSMVGARSDDGEVTGRCTGYLSRLRADDSLSAWPLRYPLTLDGSGPPGRPLLVIATGIAAAGPLCELRHADDQRPVWLLCGLRRFSPDQPLTQRLLAFAREFPQCRMDIALSRDEAPADPSSLPDNCHWHDNSRVQDVVDTLRERLDGHLRSDGDLVVIGHNSMGAEIRDRLKRSLVDDGRAEDVASAAGVLHGLEDSLRVQYSLSGL